MAIRHSLVTFLLAGWIGRGPRTINGLRAAQRPVTLLTFPGGHTMPPPRVTAAAVAWLDGLHKTKH